MADDGAGGGARWYRDATAGHVHSRDWFLRRLIGSHVARSPGIARGHTKPDRSLPLACTRSGESEEETIHWREPALETHEAEAQGKVKRDLYIIYEKDVSRICSAIIEAGKLKIPGKGIAYIASIQAVVERVPCKKGKKKITGGRQRWFR